MKFRFRFKLKSAHWIDWKVQSDVFFLTSRPAVVQIAIPRKCVFTHKSGSKNQFTAQLRQYDWATSRWEWGTYFDFWVGKCKAVQAMWSSHISTEQFAISVRNIHFYWKLCLTLCKIFSRMVSLFKEDGRVAERMIPTTWPQLKTQSS